jgi:hypothetical protein
MFLYTRHKQDSSSPVQDEKGKVVTSASCWQKQCCCRWWKVRGSKQNQLDVGTMLLSLLEGKRIKTKKA